jgi:IS30 family transposase
MTTDQKHAIEALRHEGAGYGAIAAQMGIPRETVKTFCRRNNLCTGALQRARTAPPIPNRRTVFPQHGSRIVCEITVSYAESTDATACGDIIQTLMQP